ncbi:unnamed protein product, partial [Rotaria socialis]
MDSSNTPLLPDYKQFKQNIIENNRTIRNNIPENEFHTNGQ